MTGPTPFELHDLLVDVEVLKTVMETIMNGRTESHAKWVSFKSNLRKYNSLAQRYILFTSDKSLPLYDSDKVKGSMDTVWPVQKEIFETVYTDLLTLHGRLTRRLPQGVPTGFDDLLHPLIQQVAIRHYKAGDYRSAVIDSILALSDKLRQLTSLDLDGHDLCNHAFSLGNPILIFSEIASESGKNDQVGFLEIFKGLYRGVRNPKSHSLIHDLDAVKAGQYLVFISLLMRRIMEAKKVKKRRSGGVVAQRTRVSNRGISKA